MGAYESRGYLFSDLDLHAGMETQRKEIPREVNGLDANQVLNTAPEDLIKYFVDKHWIQPPTLRRDEWVAESKEAQATVTDYGQSVTIPITRVEVEIPFDGERDLFRARPSQYSLNPPRAEIRQCSLVLSYEIRHGSQGDVRSQVDQDLNEVEKYLDRLRSDVEVHNKALHRLAEEAIRHRRERILETQGIVASLGIPLRERPGASRTYTAPSVRKKVSPTLPPASTAPFSPEPALAMEHYEHVLKVVQNMTEVMERSPTTFATMGEESLRDHYLVQLNGHFEGQATGETFNASGKTDILLRIEGKNAFIAECKFWKGKNGYSDTIDQLLSYSSWRDTKTAIFIFNRNLDTSKVLNEIESATQGHKNYKRTLAWPHESAWRFVMHHPTDTNRELIMTVLVFDIPFMPDTPASGKKKARIGARTKKAG